MMRPWLRALARKWLSGHKMRRTSGSTRRQPVRPRVEALEERTVTTLMLMEPPGLMAMQPAADTSAADAADAGYPAIDASASLPPGVTGPQAGGPGWERLLEDVQKIEPTAGETPFMRWRFLGDSPGSW